MIDDDQVSDIRIISYDNIRVKRGGKRMDAGISFENYEIAKDGILHQLELCKQGEITEEEFLEGMKCRGFTLIDLEE